jgi:penicillin-binding protein 1A
MIDPEVTGGQRWEPKNFDGKYEGPMRMRTALAKSKNMVSIRILEAIGPKYAQDYVVKFGFDADKQPPYLTMALGAGSVTQWQMVRAYAVFANGGYLVQPYFIQRVVDDHGNALGSAEPQHAGDENLRVIDARNVFIMDNMMQDVTRVGTGARAAKLKRHDVAGKTGTTNEFVDAWFCGYTPSLVGIAWVGYDQPKSLGRNQTGSAVALPIWLDYMEVALKSIPEILRPVPDGVVAVQTGPDPSQPDASKATSEYFYREYVPAADTAPSPASPAAPGAAPATGTPGPSAPAPVPAPAAQAPATLDDVLKRR